MACAARIGNRIQRGLGVAGAGQQTGKIAGFGTPAPFARPQVRLDQPQEGAPGFHRGAEIMHGDGLDALAVLYRGPAFGEKITGGIPQRLPDGLLRPQPRLVTHATVL